MKSNICTYVDLHESWSKNSVYQGWIIFILSWRNQVCGKYLYKENNKYENNLFFKYIIIQIMYYLNNVFDKYIIFIFHIETYSNNVLKNKLFSYLSFSLYRYLSHTWFLQENIKIIYSWYTEFLLQVLFTYLLLFHLLFKV
jgi:hypothetical protein